MYEFRPLRISDLGLIEKWLNRDHVREWWGDPSRELPTIRSSMIDPSTDAFIVTLEDLPIDYQQCWALHADNSCCDQPIGTRGIDQFIGEPGFIGRGHGSAFIRVFVDRLFEKGVPRVVTDPDPRNIRAKRSYMKAGFRPIGRNKAISDRPLLMRRDTGTVPV